ncbi:MAG: OsmC family protein [Microbacteriaceae bacterium]
MTAKPLHFTVTGKAESPTKLAVSVRDFTFVIDEPPSFGGADSGPNPVEYTLAALAGCMNVVIHLIAHERGVEVRSLHLTAHGELDPAHLMGQPTENRSGFRAIELIAEIDADADASELDEILRLAESRCPVSDNLSHETPLTIRLASSAQ